jgi:ribonuclease HI
MYFEGTLNLERVGAGVLLISPQGEQLKYVLQIHYKASNNGAEHEALIHRLRIAVSLGIKRLLLLAIPRSSSSKSKRSGIASRTRWMFIAPRFANSKATPRELSFSTSHETTMLPPTYFPS